MKRANTLLARLFLDKGHGFAAPAMPTILFLQIKFVDKSVASEPLQAVAEADHHVADGRISIQNQPRRSEIRIPKQRLECSASFLFIETMPVEGIVIPHESQKSVHVRFDRQAKLRVVMHLFLWKQQPSAIRASAGSTPAGSHNIFRSEEHTSELQSQSK